MQTAITTNYISSEKIETNSTSHSTETCISPTFYSSPPFFRNMQPPPPPPTPCHTHQGKIPDSMMIHQNQGD